MKSIRLSLIVYFVVLLAFALGGVSALAYQMTATTLHDKQTSTENLIRAQFQTRCQDARTALDRQLLRQAHLLASKAGTKTIPSQPIYLTLAAASGTNPMGRLLAPLWFEPSKVWLAPGAPLVKDPFANHMHYKELQNSVRTLVDIQIPAAAAEALMPADDDHPLEVFQTYRRNGVPVQRSASLEDAWLTLSDETRKKAVEFQGEFDYIEIDDRTMRRVTLKVPVAAPPRFFFTPPNRNPGPGKSKGQAIAKQPTAGGGAFTWTLFVQYASETSHLDAQVREFENIRDTRLADTLLENRAALSDLRRRIIWISALTFVGIVIGGYVLLRLGLAPLARLSDAVSKVSEKNFDLQLDAKKLPTELRPIAERLSQSLRQLHKAFDYEKQAAADISHELRTPLAALMTTLEVALRKQRSPQEYRDILEECRFSGKHMSHLVERLMALARLDAGVDRPALELVDVAELAQQCADMVRPLAEEQGLTLTTDMDDSAETVTDASKLREIVLNLLHNAISYNKPHGSIELTTSRENGHVLLAVRDTGIGIAPEAQAHLFERFFRADPSRHADTPHCGLGLAIVKSCVELLEGSIHVASSQAGTTFQIRLPARAEAATATDLQTLVHSST